MKGSNPCLPTPGAAAPRADTLFRNLLCVLVAGFLMAWPPAPAHAQSTAATIFGWGPAGQTVKAKSTTGMHRHTTIGDSGRYNLRSLPLGTYTVTLEDDGKVTDKRSNITLSVGRNAEVDFACPNDKCAK